MIRSRVVAGLVLVVLVEGLAACTVGTGPVDTVQTWPSASPASPASASGTTECTEQDVINAPGDTPTIEQVLTAADGVVVSGGRAAAQPMDLSLQAPGGVVATDLVLGRPAPDAVTHLASLTGRWFPSDAPSARPGADLTGLADGTYIAYAVRQRIGETIELSCADGDERYRLVTTTWEPEAYDDVARCGTTYPDLPMARQALRYCSAD